MSIFSRLADIVNSNLNAILAGAEDPEKMVRLVIQEMEDTLVEVRSQAVRTIADRKALDRRRDELQRDEADWERKAELALHRDREDLARGALQARHNAERARQDLEHQIEAIRNGLDQQNDDIAKLQAKLADARNRQRALASRRSVATGRLRVREKLADARIADAFARFEHVERALDLAEGRVESYDLGAAARPSLRDELAGLETDAAVDDDLRRLKQRIGSRTAPDGGA